MALQIIAELPDGFLKITDILHEKLDTLNEVFGPRAVKGLSELLPKLSKYKNPPHLEKDSIPKYAVSSLITKEIHKGNCLFHKEI